MYTYIYIYIYMYVYIYRARGLVPPGGPGADLGAAARRRPIDKIAAMIKL